MKKIILGLVTFVFALFVVPNIANAAVIVLGDDGKCDQKTTGDVKLVTCNLYFDNTGRDQLNGAILNFDLELGDAIDTNSVKFTVEGKYATEYETDKIKKFQIKILTVPAGEKVKLGVVEAEAEPSGNCDVGIVPTIKTVSGQDIDYSDNSNDEDSPSTGYAVPYIALAAGTVGIITFVAVSKKKTKMYKI